MDECESLGHTRWECKLCAAAHNLHYVLSAIMCSGWCKFMFRRRIFTLDST